jgi:hypothetical protein
MDALVDHPDAYIFGSKGWCGVMLAYAGGQPQRPIEIVSVRQVSPTLGLYRLQVGMTQKGKQ